MCFIKLQFFNLKVLLSNFNVFCLDAWDYIERIRDNVEQLANRVLKAQQNLARIFSLVNAWSDSPLFSRHNMNKDSLLALDEAPERVSKRYGGSLSDLSCLEGIQDNSL